MKNTYKLAILIVVFAVSMIPLAYFWFNDYTYAKDYISQLTGGYASIYVNVPRDSFMIWSFVVTGFWETSLSYMIVVICSAIVFPISLVLIAILLYQIKFNKQRNG